MAVRKPAIALIALVLAGGATALASWQFAPFVERRLELILQDKGLRGAELTVDRIGFHGAALRDLRVGDPDPLVLNNIAITYSLRDLWNRRLDELAVTGLSLSVRRGEEGWVVSGLEGLNRTRASDASPLKFLSPAQAAAIPFAALTLKDSDLRLTAPFGTLAIPLDIAWRKGPPPQVSYKGDGLVFRRGDLEMTARDVTLDAAAADGQPWRSTWKMETIKAAGVPLDVPPLAGSGTVAADAGYIEAAGTLASADRQWHADFRMAYKPQHPAESAFTIVRAAMPWKEGALAVSDVRIPLGDYKNIRVDLQVRHVDIAALIGSMTGGRVTATGAVSGSLPLLIGRDGKITPLRGNLRAEGPGSITMPPETIPGDHPQVSLVRQIMEDLQYSLLSIEAVPGPDGRLGLKMTVEGKNPKVYGGQAVKLNINLTGDVLEFFEQNLKLLTSPESLLKPADRRD